MEVLDIIEHKDGSATYHFDMTAEEKEAMCRNGILWAIVCGCTGLTVDEAMKYSKYGDEQAEEPTDE